MVHQQLSRGNGDDLQRCITDPTVNTRGRFEQLWLLHCPARDLSLALDSRHCATTGNNECDGIVQLPKQEPTIRFDVSSLHRALLSDSLVDIGKHDLSLVGHTIPC